jgi:ubiquinone/menaquinone biosynthesis C-methylase UbiE
MEFAGCYSGTPPWDIGRPQPEIIRLAEAKEIKGDVLDVGCGTGENALYLAKQGHKVVGVDIVSEAIRRAKTKAESRGLDVSFLVGDALHLQVLRRQFDTIVDSGLFHTFSDDQRTIFRDSLGSVLKRGGAYLMLCFNEHEPTWWGGPRRVTQRELRACFSKNWKINYIREARFDSNLAEVEGHAWCTSITRL